MGISTKLKNQWAELSEKQVKELIKMSWNDNTSYEEINKKYSMGPNELEKFLRTYMDEKEFKRWKKRILSKRGRKHSKKQQELNGE